MVRVRRVDVRGAIWLPLLCAALVAQPAAGQGVPGDRLAARLDTLFAPYSAPGSPGCVVGVARDGKTLVERAYGMADLERSVPNDTATIFDAGSVSKQFTAAAVLLLARRDSLTLDDDVRRWVPEVPALGNRPITVRDLLHHASGLREWGVIAALQGWPVGTAAYTNAHVLDIVARQRALNFEPGTEFLYSNTNYNLLAIVVQRVTGRTLAEYTRSAIFLPLGMRHTGWRDDYARVVPHRALAYVAGHEPFAAGTARVASVPRLSDAADDAYGPSGLLTTVGDLLLWNEELRTGRVLGLTAELERPTVLSSGRRVAYGAGLFLTSRHGERQVWHAGAAGGFRAYLARVPERNVSVALLCNWGEANPFVIGHVLLDVVLGPTRDASYDDPALRGLFRPMIISRRSPFAGLYRDAATAEAVRFVPDTSRGPYAGASALVTVSATEYRLTTSPGIRLVVKSVPGQRRPRLLWIPPDADTTVLEPVEPFRPETPLTDYMGDWYSPETESVLHVGLEGDSLEALIRPDTRLELAPIYADGFAARGVILRFDRNPAGLVTGLGVWAPRARDIRFLRLAP